MSDETKNFVNTIFFVAMLILILIINVLKNDIDISLTERRKLAMFPEFTITKLFNGDFINQFEKYTMDQFVKRDGFRKIKTFFELNVFGKKDINNVYQYHGNIVKQEYPLNEKSVENFTKKINNIKEKYLDKSNNIYYSIIPDKNYFAENDHLKMNYSELEKTINENLKEMKYINLFNVLTLNDYYNSDLHWKQENLGNVANKISEEMNFKDRIKTDFTEKYITNFKGVYYGQLQVDSNEDNIKILSNEIIENCKVYNFETNKQTSIYDMEKIDSADKYDIYLSGATPLLTIQNEKCNSDKELIVFRDSFGSSLVPLFTEAYKKITLIDTRYIATDYLKDYVDFSNKDVLFIYSTVVINNSSTLK